MENINKGIENIKKKKTFRELKSILTKMKKSLELFNSIFEQAEENWQT